MLTRIEVNGFKNLVNFSLDFGPFTCIAGQNGVGKSNIFDVLRFLSLLTDHTIMDAALRVRGSGVTIRDLFYVGKKGRLDSFKIAAEMIVDPNVIDDFGRSAEASSTYLRYEVEIGYEAPTPTQLGTLGRLVLLSESLNYITEGEAASKLKFPYNAISFRKRAVINKRRTSYISVRQTRDGQTEMIIHQDAGAKGPAQTAPANTAPRTIVGTSITSLTPTILAARREMQKWQFLSLEPSAMRTPDSFQTNPYVTSSGSHLPAAVYRLVSEAQKRGEDPDAIYASISARLAELVSVTGISIDIDETRQLLTLKIQEQNGVGLPAESMSDGTLRFLALSILVADSYSERLVCIEEPENGIHPAKMEQMVKLLKDLALDPFEELGPENPFRQVIVATHSPAFVQLQYPSDLVFATETLLKGNNGHPIRTLRCRPLENTWRALSGEPAVGIMTILAYLSKPPGAQLELPGIGSLV